MTHQQAVLRFAPSPNGKLHLGHAYSALMNAALARLAKGRFLVRLEDIDQTRCTAEKEAAVLEDLHWLGLVWNQPEWRQSRRFHVYQAALGVLKEKGLIYPSVMTRGAIKKHVTAHPDWPRDPDGTPLYPGKERGLTSEEQQDLIDTAPSYAWRLNMRKALEIHDVEGAARWGDVVLARKETPTSYHISVVVDDAAQGITHIVRGQDLEASTAIHKLLQKLLNLPTPRYLHHRLICDDTGIRLSKSSQSTALSALRAEGATLDDIKAAIDWDEQEVTDYFTALF